MDRLLAQLFASRDLIVVALVSVLATGFMIWFLVALLLDERRRNERPIIYVEKVLDSVHVVRPKH